MTMLSKGFAALLLGGGNVLINAGNGNLMANDVTENIISSGGVTADFEGRIKTIGN